MSHDSANERARQLPMPSLQQVEDSVLHQSQALVPAGRRRGKPATLTALHLCLGIVLCGLEGFGSQLKLWRRLCLEPIGPFAPVRVVDQAIYNRLERAAGVMRGFFEQASLWMSERSRPGLARCWRWMRAPWTRWGAGCPSYADCCRATQACWLGASAPCLTCGGNNGCG